MATHAPAQSIALPSTIVVPFQGNELILVDRDGEPFVAMKPLVEGIGLEWAPQLRKLSDTSGNRWGTTMMVVPGGTAKSGPQATLCMPLRKLPGWLMTLQPSRFASKKSAAIIQIYQEECDDVLWSYWTKGHVSNPRLATSPVETYPAGWNPTWNQSPAEKLEQARSCSKGTYEMVKKDVLPAVEITTSILDELRRLRAQLNAPGVDRPYVELPKGRKFIHILVPCGEGFETFRLEMDGWVGRHLRHAAMRLRAELGDASIGVGHAVFQAMRKGLEAHA